MRVLLLKYKRMLIVISVSLPLLCLLLPFYHSSRSKAVKVVHYVWSGRKRKFVFRDCLSVLSIVRVLQPLQIIFHHDTLPLTDSYHSWLLELKSAIPGLEFHQTDFESTDLLDVAIQILPPEGGVVVGNGAILSHPSPACVIGSNSLIVSTSSSDPSQGIVFACKGFKKETGSAVNTKKLPLRQNCVTAAAYNSNLTNRDNCVLMTSEILPRDIYATKAPLAELARWLFYGKRALQEVKQDFLNPIPRISHYIMLNGRGAFSSELSFHHFLNIVSALYVGGFERVYLHVETAPFGHWWEELAGENVTVVKVTRPRSVYQTEVKVIQHVSDVIRAELLYKYGGAYQDLDVTWVKRVPDWLLAYPTVIDVEVEYNKVSSQWPDIFNNGVILSRRHAPWLRHFLETMRDYRDDDWAYNSLRMSYKTFEQYPDTVYIDRYLQVMCGGTVCYPPWDEAYDTKYHPALRRFVCYRKRAPSISAIPNLTRLCHP